METGVDYFGQEEHMFPAGEQCSLAGAQALWGVGEEWVVNNGTGGSCSPVARETLDSGPGPP